MAADRDRFSTATRLRALGSQAAERVYRAQHRRLRTPGRSRLTGRAAVLVLVLCSLVVALAYPIRQYVSQRSEIAEQRERAEAVRKRVEELRREKARWQDPAYVERMARQELHFVRPGEVGYTIRNGNPRVRRSPGQGPADRAWYRDLWDAVDAADAAGTADRRR